MDVDAFAPARLLDREVLFLRRPAAHGPRRMGGMHRVPKQHDLVLALGIQQVLVAGDERLLRLLVAPGLDPGVTRDDFGLVIFQSQAMQQRDQSGAAFVDKPKLLGDPGADLARRTRKARRHPDLQGLGLLGAHLARTAAHVEGGQAFDAARSKRSCQPRIVSSSNNRTFATSWQLMPSSNSTRALARRVTRHTLEPSRANATSVCRSSSLRKSPRIMPRSE